MASQLNCAGGQPDPVLRLPKRIFTHDLKIVTATVLLSKMIDVAKKSSEAIRSPSARHK